MSPRVYLLVDESELELWGPVSLLGDEWPLARVEVGGRRVLPFHRGALALELSDAEVVEVVELIEVPMESFP